MNNKYLVKLFSLSFVFLFIVVFDCSAAIKTTGSKRKIRSSVKSLVRKKALKQTNRFKLGKKKKKPHYTSRRAVPSGADIIGAGQHPQALRGLPVDKFGLVNWVQAVKQLQIAPIDHGENRRERIYDGTVIYNALNPEWGDVIFDHDIHTYFIDCDSCHPKPFEMTPGKAKIFMIKIKRGKFCGKCHGKIAFPIENCERCHVLPKTNIKW